MREQRTTMLVPWARDLPLDVVMARTQAVKHKVVVRVTGGCADMPAQQATGMMELFTQAFRGFCGLQLIGGTRMLSSSGEILPGITEVGPAIRTQNPDSVLVGVIPRTECLTLGASVVVYQGVGIQGDFTTIVHPDQDIVVMAVTHLTRDEIWDDEVEFCRFLTRLLVVHGNWRSLLVAYNGGSVTEAEVRATAARNWPVLLIEGSGRTSDRLAEDGAFLQGHPSVTVCQNTVTSMRDALFRLNVLPTTNER